MTMNDTMRRAFRAGIDREFEESAAATTPTNSVILRDPDNNMTRVQREDFKEDDVGVTIAEEFIIGWDGIDTIDSRDGACRVTLKDGKWIEVEAMP